MIAFDLNADLRLADIGLEREIRDTLNFGNDIFDLLAQPIEHRQVLAVNFGGKRGANPRNQFLYAHLNRLGKSDNSRRHHHFQLLAHGLSKLFDIAVSGPFALGLECRIDLHIIGVGGFAFLCATDHCHRGLDLWEFRQRVLDILGNFN